MFAESVLALDEEAYFCPNCINESSARQVALTHAPPALCDYGNPPPFPPVSCQPVYRRIILGNHLTRQRFAFIVGTIDSFRQTAEPDSLSPAEQRVIDQIFDLRHDWESMSLEWVVENGTVQAGAAGRIPLKSQTTGGGSCPSNTALDHVLNPSFMQLLKDAIVLRTMNRLAEHASDGNPQVRRATGVGVSLGGVGFSFQWENPNQNNFTASFGFPVSEVDTPIRDVLVFRVELLGMNLGTPILEVDFAPGASRAAGAFVDDLLNGNVTVSSPCIFDKLEDLQISNPDLDFRFGGPIGDLVDFNHLGNLGGGKVCSRTMCASVTIRGEPRQCQYFISVAIACD